jgi:hypothetical protein
MKVQEIILESAAWRRKEGKSKAGGLNKVGANNGLPSIPRG